MTYQLNTLHNPSPDDIGNSVEQFLEELGGASLIHQQGIDGNRTRAFITLLHGNEPSGVEAIFNWLKSGQTPAVNLLIFIVSIKAALLEPRFTHRAIPGQRDQNRCFKTPYDIDEEGRIAQCILQTLNTVKPEAAIDMHNTSGSSPSFAVATHLDEQHDALAGLFTQRLIITDLRLGAIMEISDYLCPTVTIECGGRDDENSANIASEGIVRFFTLDNIFGATDSNTQLEILNNPVRLELKPSASITYQLENLPHFDVVLRPDIEHFNASIVPEGTSIGWFNCDSLGDALRCDNMTGESVLEQILEIGENNTLLVRQAVKLFMITTHAGIAASDCLFYAVNKHGNVITAKLAND